MSDDPSNLGRRASDRPHRPYWLRLALDGLVALPLLVGGLVILWQNDAAAIVRFTAGIIVLFAGIAFVVRWVLFPFLNIERTVRRAHDHPIGAAVVVAATMYLVVQIFAASVALLR